MADYYSDIAAGYDELHGEEQDAKLKEFLERVELRVNSTVLDVGCGTGRSQQLIHEVQWHGIEPSRGLIDHASPEAKLRITKGVAEDIPFPDASFDCVLCLTVLQNVKDPERAVKELRRVCKPGGVLFISVLKKSPKTDELAAAIRTLHVKESWEQAHDLMYLCTRTQDI